MGARLAAAARTYAFPHLPTDRARVVLFTMALTALDTDTRPVYFGGSDYLADCFGYPPGSQTGARKVARALAELQDAGFITQAPGNRHHKRRWLLHLSAPKPVDNPHGHPV